MSLRITGVRSATSEEWDKIWRNCDYATYFHSREWAEIWHKYSQGKMRPEAKTLIFSDDKTVLLPFTSQRVSKWIFKQYISSPAGTFGGWLSINELSESHGQLLYEYILGQYKSLLWRINPYNSLESGLNTKGAKDDETHALDLELGFEAIHKQWTKGHASAARKARKEGIVVREASDLQDWKLYYNIYIDSLMRWGEAASSRYEWRFFHNMYDLSSVNVKLWLATLESKVVAGALCFYSKNHVSYWHGAAYSKYFKLRPVNLLMYEIIRNSCERGYYWFDFNPSGGHEGVRAFKKSFGAVELACPVIKTEHRVIGLAREIIRRCKKIAS